jgi:hypothetical protein
VSNQVRVAWPDYCSLLQQYTSALIRIQEEASGDARALQDDPLEANHLPRVWVLNLAIEEAG